MAVHKAWAIWVVVVPLAGELIVPAPRILLLLTLTALSDWPLLTELMVIAALALVPAVAVVA